MQLFLLAAVGILAGAQAAHAAQAAQATVAGTVRDQETGGALAGAVVALTDLDRAIATDAQGRYALRLIPAGPHHITIRRIGYAQRTLHALVPRDGQLEINVSLRPEPVRLQTVVVRPPVSVRGVESGSDGVFPDREVSMAAVRNHPLLAEPDALQALGGGEVVLRPEAPSGVHIRGGASDHTAYLLDGIPVFSPYHAAGVFSAWNPDALARLSVSSAAPPAAYPDALSGAVAALTRAPGEHFQTHGGVSTTQARVTIDGPLGRRGASYLMSLRTGFPGFLPPRHDPSYVRGESGDWLGKLEAPALGGRFRVLGYSSENEISTVAVADQLDRGSGRNVFDWKSRSLGGEWKRAFPRLTPRVVAWSATSSASSLWTSRVARVGMAAARRDEGVLAAIEHRSTGATTEVGVRVERSRTSYRIRADSAATPSWAVSARTPVAAAFAQHDRALGERVDATLGATVAAAAGDVHFGPRAQLRWRPSERLALSGSYARLHQFAQSLRNAESVVGTVFPFDLYMGAGAPGVPVARSDQGVIAAHYRPLAGVRLGVQAYQRWFDGLVLVAPRVGEPFTTGIFAAGSGASRGVSVEAAASTARLGLVANYGLQRVRLRYGDSSYVPDHGTTHLLDGGVIVFPTATFSVRLGLSAALTRRTTRVAGGLEWEACNLLDRGCEFGGSPEYGGEPLGATHLPAYLRLDVGLRKHWHVHVGTRDAVLTLFGTVTNLFNRPNVLTYALDPATGDPVPIEMRPLGPLVVGLDWRF